MKPLHPSEIRIGYSPRAMKIDPLTVLAVIGVALFIIVIATAINERRKSKN